MAHNKLPSDDAPLVTRKEDLGEQARSQLIEPHGDTLVGKTVTINRPKAELYSFWRDFTNLPRFMENVVSVVPVAEGRTHWMVKAPAGKTGEWSSVITADRPDEAIAWTSEEGADVPNSGRIDFRDAPGGRGTWVSATILYDPPSGIIGKVVAKMFQREPAIQARRDLRRFKQLMETGEIASSRWTRQQHEEID